MFVSIVAALALSPQHMRHHVHQHGPKRPAKVVDETPGIHAGYADVKRAFETKNWTLFRSRCAPNFVEELPNRQRLNLKQTIAGMRKQMEPLSDIKVNFNLQDVKVTGHTATVLARFNGDGKFRDKKGMHKMHLDGSETDSLKKVGGRWVAYFVKVHDQSVSVDV